MYFDIAKLLSGIAAIRKALETVGHAVDRCQHGWFERLWAHQVPPKVFCRIREGSKTPELPRKPVMKREWKHWDHLL